MNLIQPTITLSAAADSLDPTLSGANLPSLGHHLQQAPVVPRQRARSAKQPLHRLNRSAKVHNEVREITMRKFLVVLDDSRECLNAMRFAAMRAAHTGGGVAILSIIPPEEFNHWIGVGEIMREEARERIEVHYEVFAKWMRDRQNVRPELIIREGEPLSEILAQVKEDPEIGVLVLGAGTDNKGPGPLVTQLTRQAGNLPVPITIVPGDLSKERLEAIT